MSRGLNLNRGSNSLNSASEYTLLKNAFALPLKQILKIKYLLLVLIFLLLINYVLAKKKILHFFQSFTVDNETVDVFLWSLKSAECVYIQRLL